LGPGLGGIAITDAIDVLFVTLLVWAGISFVRESRARIALTGLGGLAVFYWLALELDLRLTTRILQGFFALAALVLVVVFQEDLRRFFERIAVWGLRRGAPRAPADTRRILADLIFQLASARTGALLVLPGREPLDRQLEGGTSLDGWLSPALLLSIFDTRTPGHDGAVVIRGHRVTRFGVHLPLSTDWAALGSGGTRHAAALGLAERSDALCFVVSEERGTVSVARAGEIRVLPNAEAALAELAAFFDRSTRTQPTQSFASTAARAIGRHWREGLISAGIASALWFVAIPGSTVDRAARTLPIVVENVPEGYTVESIDPPEVEVTFEGRRRDLFLLARPDEVSVRLDALLVQLGRRTFRIEADQIDHPKELEVVSVAPAKVKLKVVR